jgi:hypothetical protein
MLGISESANVLFVFQGWQLLAATLISQSIALFAPQV